MGRQQQDVAFGSTATAAASRANGSARRASAAAQMPLIPAIWDREVDIVVIGAGAPGFPPRSSRARPAAR